MRKRGKEIKKIYRHKKREQVLTTTQVVVRTVVNE